MPSDSLQEFIRGRVKRPEEFHKGVQPGQSQATLKLADLSSMQARANSKVLLREAGSLATALEVLRKPLCQLHSDSSRSK